MDDRLKRLNKLTDRIEKLCEEAKEIEPTFKWQWHYTVEGTGGLWTTGVNDPETYNELGPTILGSTM